MRRNLIGAALSLGLGGMSVYQFQDVLIPLIGGKPNDKFILLSGNIEAHESILSFKTVQSRIVELPLDEGESVKKDTLLARWLTTSTINNRSGSHKPLSTRKSPARRRRAGRRRDASDRRQRRGGRQPEAARIRPRPDAAHQRGRHGRCARRRRNRAQAVKGGARARQGAGSRG
jgi:hypothetical protein